MSARLLRVAAPPLADELLDITAEAERLHARLTDALRRVSAEAPAESQTHLPLYLTVQEAAEQAQVSRATIYAMCHAGELECLRVGKAIRVRTAALAGLSKQDRVNGIGR